MAKHGKSWRRRLKTSGIDSSTTTMFRLLKIAAALPDPPERAAELKAVSEFQVYRVDWARRTSVAEAARTLT
jgi:hypothetical protein